MDMEELFSKRLTELISNGGFTLDKIEQYVGKSNATISRYASGEIKGVKRSTIVKLANFFNVSPAWLAGFTDEKYDNLKSHNNQNLLQELELIYGKYSSELLKNFGKLNDFGKQKANDNIHDLTKIKEYTDKKTES